jgi:hypothetical protein
MYAYKEKICPDILSFLGVRILKISLKKIFRMIASAF